MSGSLKIFSWGFLAVVIIATGFFGWRYYRIFSQQSAEPFYAVTPNALFFAEFPDAGLSHRKLLETPLWKSMLGMAEIELFSQQFRYMDSLILAAEPEISVSMRSLLVSVNMDAEGSLIPLYILSLPPGDKEKMVGSFIRKVNALQSIVMQTKYRNTVINMVNIPSLEKFFHYMVYRGLFVGSFDVTQLEMTIDHLSDGKAITKDADFQKIRQTAGKNVDANIYFRYHNLGPLAHRVASGELLEMMHEIRRFGKLGEVDLVIHDSSWLFNGYSVADDRSTHLLDCFRQEPQVVNIPSVLPENTAYMSHFGVQKFDKLFEDFLKFRHDSTECLGNLALMKKNFDIAPYDDLISWIGNEFAIAGIEPSEEPEADLVVVIHTFDALKAKLSLREVSEKLDRSQNLKSFSLQHGDYTIGKINYPALAEVLFGHLFSGMEENYYVLIKDYVILANHPDVLKKLTDRFYVSKTLHEDINYRLFSNNLADKSNIYLYGNIPSSVIKGSGKILKGTFYDWILNNQTVLSGLEGLAIQFSFVNQMFYTNGYLKFNPGFLEPIPYAWSFDLKNGMTATPSFVRNSQTGKKDVLVLDTMNHLYLSDHNGRIQWSIQVSEPPVSKFHFIDFFRNGETQILFNSESHIHLLGMDGYYVEGFPVKLIRKATNGLAVFDYNNYKEYRLVIALDDNRIYNFDRNGNEVEGFNKIQSRAKVTKPVQHLVASGKDYFFVTDMNGEVIITSHRGEDRIGLEKRLDKGTNSSFYLNQTNKTGLFLTTDQKGNLVYLDADGKITRSFFGDFSPGHYFFYEDFDGDGNHDFIFLDGKKITVYDRFKKVTCGYDLPGEVISEPVLFSSGQNKKYLGVVLQGIQQVMIFDHRGRVFEHLAFSGNTSFAVTNLNNDHLIHLVSGMGNKVFNYKLE
jgi:hypothetical protein